MTRRSASKVLTSAKKVLNADGAFPMACGITPLGSQAIALMEQHGLSALPVAARKIDNSARVSNAWKKANESLVANSPEAPTVAKAENLPSAPAVKNQTLTAAPK